MKRKLKRDDIISVISVLDGGDRMIAKFLNWEDKNSFWAQSPKGVHLYFVEECKPQKINNQ